MSFVAALADLRARHPGCHAVVYGDLRTGIVLAFDADPGHTQEDHMALLSTARQFFPRAGAGLGAGAESVVDMPMAMLIAPDGGQAFLRHAIDAPEVLSARWTAPLDPAALAADMASLLAENG